MRSQVDWKKDRWTCANSIDFCNELSKDMRRCCPQTCGNRQRFTENVCNMDSGGGECIYPFDTFYSVDNTCWLDNSRELRKKVSSLGIIISLQNFSNLNDIIKSYESYNARIFSFITIIDLKWVLVKPGAKCLSNERVYGGRFHDIENCAIACKDNSSMFIYCKDYSLCCDTNGCECFCETSALLNGTCQVEEVKEYTLYKYLKGKVLEFGRFTCSNQEIKSNLRVRFSKTYIIIY